MSAPGLALAADMASRKEQSALHVPSLVSAVLVTAKVAARAGLMRMELATTDSNAIHVNERVRAATDFKNGDKRYFSLNRAMAASLTSES